MKQPGSFMLPRPTRKLLPLHFTREITAATNYKSASCIDGTTTSPEADFGRNFQMLFYCNICILIFPNVLALRTIFCCLPLFVYILLGFDCITLYFQICYVVRIIYWVDVIVTMHYVIVFYVRYRRFGLKLKFLFKFDNPNLVLRTEGCNACYICFGI